jgi:nitroreductase
VIVSCLGQGREEGIDACPACEAGGLGCCAVAAFDDDEVDRILGLDGREEFAIDLATVGRVKAGSISRA